MPSIRPLPILLTGCASACLLCLTQCGPTPEAKTPATSHSVAPAAPTEELSQAVEALTGAHTRIVWSHHLGTSSPDPYANGSSHELLGLDTRDGLGTRVILPGKDNFSRPLLSPDGNQVFFTRKVVERDKSGKKTFNMTIQRTNWTGAEPTTIGDGMAVDVWTDPQSGKTWVYAVQDVPSTPRISFAANQLVRIDLGSPETIEVVWNQTQISADNIQLSADGRRACGQIPWPQGGQFVWDGDTRDFMQTTIGCWAGMAPDNSYVSWMLDGSHRFVNLFVAAPQEKRWTLDFSQIPGLEKGEIYHPRWSNHAQFITLTGPYLGKASSHDESVIGKGGRHAEIVIAKVNDTLDAFTGSVTLTRNNDVDCYPDLWIAGGETAILTQFAQEARADTTATDWPPTTDNLLFVWKNRSAENVVKTTDGRRIDCTLHPVGAARSGSHLQMLLDGGHFEPGPIAAEYLGSLEPNAPITVEFSLVPQNAEPPNDGRLLTLPRATISLNNGKLTINGQAIAPLTLPSHLILQLNVDSVTAWINGRPTEPVPLTADPSQSPLTIGGDAVNAGLHGLALYRSGLSSANASAAAAYWAPLNVAASAISPLRARVRAKLIEPSGPPTAAGIDPYTRALVDQIFDIEEVLEGTIPGGTVLVRQWAMMDQKLTQTFAQQVGAVVELTLEPVGDHPELEGERVVDDTTAFDLEPWYDLAPPSL